MTEMRGAGFAEDLRDRLARRPTVGALLDDLGGRGFGVLIALLSLPAALPLPAAGYAVPFGLGILSLGIGLLAGRTRPWLPRRVREMRLPPLPPDSRSLRLMARLEGLFRERPPRPQGPMRVLAGTVVCCMGALMMIPIPGTNTLPGVSALLIGLGLLYRDGLWTSVGVASGIGLLGLYAAAAMGLLRIAHLIR